MADPTNPTSNVPDPSQLDAVTESSKQAAQSFDVLNSVLTNTGNSFENLASQVRFSHTQMDNIQKSAGQTGDIIGKLEDSYKDLQTTLKAGGDIGEKYTQVLGMMTNKLLGTRDAFKELGGNIDSVRLNTLSGQWASLSSTILTSGGSISSIAKTIKDKFGVELPDAIKSGGIASIGDFMSSMMRATDNTLRLQNAIVQLSARSGSLGEVFQAAGPHLENINELVTQQRKAMIDSAEATGMLPEQIEKYYGELGSIPGALTQTVGASNEILARSNGDAQGRVSMLSATILTAIGTGRQYGDVMKDLSEAFRDFGLTGEDALKFSTSISQIAKENNLDLESVQSAVRATASEFSRYADNAKNAAQMSISLSESINDYTNSLQNVGVPGNQAISIAQGLTSEMGKMSTAQKAFLSQQSGGPGGLMGAFQIEKLMKTDPGAVFEKVRKEIEKMAGPAVSVDEAASSPAAAARLVRQRELLKQGPLGNFAKTDQDASRILAMFSDMSKGQAKPSDFKDILKEPMDKGVAIQEKSLTEVTRSRIALEKMMLASDSGATETVQSNFTAGGGSNQTQFNEMQKSLRASVGAGAMASGMTSSGYGAALQTGQVTTNTGAAEMAKSLNTVGDVVNQGLGMVRGALNKSVQGLQDDVDKMKGKLSSTINPEERQSLMDSINRKTQAISAIHAQEGSLNDFSGGISPTQRLGAVASSASQRLSGATHTTTAGGAAVAAGANSPLHQVVDVNVKGLCIQCGRAMEQDSHTSATSPAYKR